MRRKLIHFDDKFQTLKLTHHGKFYSFLLEKLRHQLNETVKQYSTEKSHKTHKPETNFFLTSFLLSVLWKETFFNCTKSLVSRIK